MTEFKPRMWSLLGLSAMALVGVSACGGGGETGADGGEGEQGVSSATAPVAAPVAAGPSGESGEAGAQNAYSDIPEASRLGLRIAHVTGFILVAQKAFEAGDSDVASVLVSQGLLEVYTPFAESLDAGAPGLKAACDKIVAAIDGKQSKADIEAAFADTLKIAQKAQAKSGAAPQDTVSGMVAIAAGLYQGVVLPEGNDPIEYQHAYGAALSAQQAFRANQGKFASKDRLRAQSLAKDLDTFVGQFTAVSLPDAPPSVADITSAASRAQLAVSGIR